MLDMCRALGFEIRTDPGDSEMKIGKLPITDVLGRYSPERQRTMGFANRRPW
jgi:hypothetical protein